MKKEDIETYRKFNINRMRTIDSSQGAIIAKVGSTGEELNTDMALMQNANTTLIVDALNDLISIALDLLEEKNKEKMN